MGTTEPYVHFSPFWLLMWAHVFHFCLERQRNVWHEGEQGVWGGCTCGDGLPSTVYSGQHQLWIPACSQLPTCLHTSSFPPCVTLPPCLCSQAKAGLSLQDFWTLRQRYWPSGLPVMTIQPTSFGLFAIEMSNYFLLVWKEHKTSDTIQMRDVVHHGSVKAIKTVTVIPNDTGFPVTAQWCWNKWCL